MFSDRFAEYLSVIGRFLLSTVHIGFDSSFAEYWSFVGYFSEYYLDWNSVIGRAVRGARLCSLLGETQ